jgi:hypothetical protein
VIKVLSSLHTGHYQFQLKNNNLSTDDINLLKKLTYRRYSTRDLFIAIKNQNPNSTITEIEVKNLRAKFKKEELNGENEILQLIQFMEKYKWKYKIDKNKTGKVFSFLFIPTSSQFFIDYFGKIIIIDGTYNTNLQNYTLIQCIGITNTWQTFNLFYCFCYEEKTEDYNWILSSLKELIPSFKPNVVITDRECALTNALQTHFPHAKHLYCICLFFLYYYKFMLLYLSYYYFFLIYYFLFL